MFSQLKIKHILAIGFILRLLAVYFSRGYAFSDDHYFVMELAQEWHRGNINVVTSDSGFVLSLLYPGINYLLISFSNLIGITDPEGIMMLVRLFHALVSMAGIYYAYLITTRLTNNKETPIIVALLMAAFWMFPFLSVRNLREFFCIPFLLAGSYYAIQKDSTNKSGILSALFFVLAVCIRIQCAIIPLGIGLFWLFKKGFLKKALLLGILFSLLFFLTQGLFDWFYYGNPFSSTLTYFRYNSDPLNISKYPTGPWYQYAGTVAGMALGIPFILLVAGYIKSAKLSVTYKTLFYPSLLFFLFHSYYANKQERFILPFLPYFLILGVAGFSELYHRYKEKKWLRRTTRFGIGWFVVLNTIFLFVLTFSYSKRSRVEAMNYLRTKQNISGIIMEGINTPPGPPLFYLGKRVDCYNLDSQKLIEELQTEILNSKKASPNYIIMVGNKNLAERITRVKSAYPLLQKETEIVPGFLDNIAYKLNPKHNRNETWYIYRIE